MHGTLGGWFGEHGHSHDGKKCAGHGHGHGGHGGHLDVGQSAGHSHGGATEMSEEMRAAMLKQLELQMEMMTSGGGAFMNHGHVLRDPSVPAPSTYSSLLYGSGHDAGPPPYGWGSLAEVSCFW